MKPIQQTWQRHRWPLLLSAAAISLSLAWIRAESPKPEAVPAEKQAVSQPPRGKVDAQIEQLKNRAKLLPNSERAWIALGDAYMQKAREIIDPELHSLAKGAYQKALEISPTLPEAMLGLAWVHNSRHHFDNGILWAKKALEVNPKLAQAHSLLGDAYVELGDYEAAVEHTQRALDILPNLSSYSRAAHMMWLMGDVRRAQALMQRAIAAGGPYPENTAWCLSELANMSLQTGALLPAEQTAERALKLAPSNPHALLLMGKVKTARQDYVAALRYYRQAAENHPHPHEALVGQADVCRLMGQREEAEKHDAQVIAFHMAHSHGGGEPAAKEHIHGNAYLARFYADNDRELDIALREAEAAHRTSKNIFTTDTLAWCQYKKGQYDIALKTSREAMKWNTPDAAMHYHAGMIYLALGDRPNAQKSLAKALSLNPHFHPIEAKTAEKALEAASPRPEPAANAPGSDRPAFLTQEAP